MDREVIFDLDFLQKAWSTARSCIAYLENAHQQRLQLDVTVISHDSIIELTELFHALEEAAKASRHYQCVEIWLWFLTRYFHVISLQNDLLLVESLFVTDIPASIPLFERIKKSHEHFQRQIDCWRMNRMGQLQVQDHHTFSQWIRREPLSTRNGFEFLLTHQNFFGTFDVWDNATQLNKKPDDMTFWINWYRNRTYLPNEQIFNQIESLMRDYTALPNQALQCDRGRSVLENMIVIARTLHIRFEGVGQYREATIRLNDTIDSSATNLLDGPWDISLASEAEITNITNGMELYRETFITASQSFIDAMKIGESLAQNNTEVPHTVEYNRRVASETRRTLALRYWPAVLNTLSQWTGSTRENPWTPKNTKEQQAVVANGATPVRLRQVKDNENKYGTISCAVTCQITHPYNGTQSCYFSISLSNFVTVMNETQKTALLSLSLEQLIGGNDPMIKGISWIPLPEINEKNDTIGVLEIKHKFVKFTSLPKYIPRHQEDEFIGTFRTDQEKLRIRDIFRTRTGNDSQYITTWGAIGAPFFISHIYQQLFDGILKFNRKETQRRLMMPEEL
jgi:hypothetical protein